MDQHTYSWKSSNLRPGPLSSRFEGREVYLMIGSWSKRRMAWHALQSVALLRQGNVTVFLETHTFAILQLVVQLEWSVSAGNHNSAVLSEPRWPVFVYYIVFFFFLQRAKNDKTPHVMYINNTNFSYIEFIYIYIYLFCWQESFFSREQHFLGSTFVTDVSTMCLLHAWNVLLFFSFFFYRVTKEKNNEIYAKVHIPLKVT